MFLERIAALQQCRSQILNEFGTSDEMRKNIDKHIDSVMKYYQWRTALGDDIYRFVFGRQPQPFAVLAIHEGIDMKKGMQATSDAWILDGIKIPRFRGKAGKAFWKSGLGEILLASFFKHNSSSFDRYCDIVGYHLNDFEEGPYEYGDVCLKEGDVVFDCGANTGIFSAAASRYGGQVFAFEAVPDISEKYLAKTASMNKNISVQNFATWDKEETLVFSLSRDIGAAQCDQVADNSSRQKSRKQLTVQAITLDAFVERNGIERVDFIKADIEGAERNMLRGAKGILRDFAPKLSICTYHLPDDPQVLREIILEANPKYQIVEKFKKMYAYVP